MKTADVRIPGTTSQTVLGAWGLFTAVLLVMLGNGHHVPPGSAVAVSSLYVFVTGVGAILGPILATVMIDQLGPSGLFWLISGVNVAIVCFALLRISVRAGMPIKDQRGYAMVPARAGAVIVHAARRARHPKGSHRRGRTPE